jgi:hypothetical protein
MGARARLAIGAPDERRTCSRTQEMGSLCGVIYQRPGKTSFFAAGSHARARTSLFGWRATTANRVASKMTLKVIQEAAQIDQSHSRGPSGFFQGNASNPRYRHPFSRRYQPAQKCSTQVYPRTSPSEFWKPDVVRR